MVKLKYCLKYDVINILIFVYIFIQIYDTFMISFKYTINGYAVKNDLKIKIFVKKFN